MPDIEKEMEDKQAPRDEDRESGSLGDIQTNKARFDEIIRQYDILINDGSYKGVNLLKNDSLKVSFNEDRSSYLNIAGVDASSQALGLTDADWLFKSDVEKSLSGLDAAIASLRDFAGRRQADAGRYEPGKRQYARPADQTDACRQLPGPRLSGLQSRSLYLLNW